MERILYAGDSTVAFNKINTYPLTGMSQALPLRRMELPVKKRS